MPNNLLVTGPPRSGKTTVIRTAVDRLEDRGCEVGGIYSPEVREEGDRVGFDIADVLTGERRQLAHVDRDDGPAVGKYRVNVANVDAVVRAAFQRVRAEADVAVVDEIAPMEVTSDVFVAAVRRVLDAELPLLAAVHYRSTAGFIRTVKDRDDTETFTVSPESRDELPTILTQRLANHLDG